MTFNRQQKAVSAFMRSALEKGYAGCFVWAYGPKERYFHLVRENGEHRPVVADIRSIIKSHSKPSGKTAGSLKQKLAGTKWINSNNVSFEWTTDGRFLHKGVERQWKVVGGNRVQIIFGPKHVDTLVFNDSLTQFRQVIKGGRNSFQGRRTDR